jgi:hypothetical protein
MRFIFSSFILLSALSISTQSAANQPLANQIPDHRSISSTIWPPYPKTLIQFDYSGSKLQQNWSLLTAGIQLPWPDSAFIKTMMKQFPQLSDQLIAIAAKPNSHPALKPILQQNFLPLAEAVQEVWRRHYQGQYQQAYELGLKLGPAGLLPALYSKLIHTTFLVAETEKNGHYLEVERYTQSLLPLANNYNFLLFGDAYQKARRLELMSTSAATASGLLGPTQKSLQSLRKQFPDNPLYSAMLAGIDAGIIERVGNFLGGLTYGANEENTLTLFNQALNQEKRLAVLYNEFSLALIKLDNDDHQERIDQLLKICINLPIYSAEEALNQQTCRTTYKNRINHGS